MRTSNSPSGRLLAAHRATRLVGIAALTLVAVGSTACTPESGPTPTPTPTYTCSANVDACTQQQAEKEAKAAQDHAAAQVALQAGLTELYRLAGKGGASESTEQLRRYLAEDELDGAVKVLREFKQDKRLGHGSVRVAKVSFETKYPGDRQDVLVCEDATKFYTTDLTGGDRTPPGFRLQYTATLKLLDGQWKRTQSTDSVKVDSCES